MNIRGVRYIPKLHQMKYGNKSVPGSREEIMRELGTLQRDGAILTQKLEVWTVNQRDTARELRLAEERMALLVRAMERKDKAAGEGYAGYGRRSGLPGSRYVDPDRAKQYEQWPDVHDRPPVQTRPPFPAQPVPRQRWESAEVQRAALGLPPGPDPRPDSGPGPLPQMSPWHRPKVPDQAGGPYPSAAPEAGAGPPPRSRWDRPPGELDQTSPLAYRRTRNWGAQRAREEASVYRRADQPTRADRPPLVERPPDPDQGPVYRRSRPARRPGASPRGKRKFSLDY